MTFSLTTIVHQNSDFEFEAVRKRIEDAFESAILTRMDFDLIVIDNSLTPINEIRTLSSRLGAIYRWCDGYNTFYGPSLNMAAEMSNKESLIYFCANHGRMIDPTWISDLLVSLDDPKVGIAGCVAPCPFSIVGTVREPQLHVQGGVFAMRRDVLLAHPFSHRFPFEYSDVRMSLTLLEHGYRLRHVRTIKSVAEGVVDATGAKYVHDYQPIDTAR